MGRRTLFAATSFVGVVLAHLLSYLSPFGEAGHHTAHEHFHVLVAAACGLVPLILLLGARQALRGDAPVAVVRVSARIGVLQLAGFGLLELAERGFHIGATFSDPAVLVGLVLQVLVAAVLVWLLAGLVRVITTFAARRRRPPVPAAQPRPPSTGLLVPAPRTPFLRQLLGRAPPAPLQLTGRGTRLSLEGRMRSCLRLDPLLQRELGAVLV